MLQAPWCLSLGNGVPCSKEGQGTQEARCLLVQCMEVTNEYPRTKLPFCRFPFFWVELADEFSAANSLLDSL